MKQLNAKEIYTFLCSSISPTCNRVVEIQNQSASQLLVVLKEVLRPAISNWIASQGKTLAKKSDWADFNNGQKTSSMAFPGYRKKKYQERKAATQRQLKLFSLQQKKGGLIFSCLGKRHDSRLLFFFTLCTKKCPESRLRASLSVSPR